MEYYYKVSDHEVQQKRLEISDLALLMSLFIVAAAFTKQKVFM